MHHNFALPFIDMPLNVLHQLLIVAKRVVAGRGRV